MAKGTIYVCSNCGYTTYQWYGKCPSCQQWGTLVEKSAQGKSDAKRTKGSYKKPVKISSIKGEHPRLKTNSAFDGFFGGGLVKGGVYLISGTPGVGKSTLLLQLADMLSKTGSRVVYISAEESLEQISMRAGRLNIESVDVVSETESEAIASLIEFESADCFIVDSIHTIHSNALDSVVGGVQQVRYCAEMLIEKAKLSMKTLIIVAHVTKEGSIAGPKMLEHMVDCVAFLDNREDLRVLKLSKNRFGSTDEALIMEMDSSGLKLVSDPTMRFVSKAGATEGVAQGVIVEGKYPILVEIQALCVETPLAIPRRVSVGFDLNRLHMILAVIEKRLNLPMFKYDVYLNIAGGIKLTSTLADMAVVASILSSLKKRQLPERAVFAGEMDLAGRFRVPRRFIKHIARLKEFGFHLLSAEDGPSTINELISSL